MIQIKPPSPSPNINFSHFNKNIEQQARQLFRTQSMTSSFIQNGVNQVFNIVIVFIIMVIINKIYNAFLFPHHSTLNDRLPYKLFVMVKNKLTYSVLILAVSSSYYQLSLAIFLQYFRVSFSNTFNQVSFVLAIGGTIFCFFILIWFFYQINQDEQKKTENYQIKYQALVGKYNSTVLARNTQMIIYFKKSILMFALVFLYDQPITVLMLNLIPSFLTFLILTIYQPYLRPIDNSAHQMAQLMYVWFSLMLIGAYVIDQQMLDDTTTLVIDPMLVQAKTFFGSCALLILCFLIFNLLTDFFMDIKNNLQAPMKAIAETPSVKVKLLELRLYFQSCGQSVRKALQIQQKPKRDRIEQLGIQLQNVNKLEEEKKVSQNVMLISGDSLAQTDRDAGAKKDFRNYFEMNEANDLNFNNATRMSVETKHSGGSGAVPNQKQQMFLQKNMKINFNPNVFQIINDANKFTNDKPTTREKGDTKIAPVQKKIIYNETHADEEFVDHRLILNALKDTFEVDKDRFENTLKTSEGYYLLTYEKLFSAYFQYPQVINTIYIYQDTVSILTTMNPDTFLVEDNMFLMTFNSEYQEPFNQLAQELGPKLNKQNSDQKILYNQYYMELEKNPWIQFKNLELDDIPEHLRRKVVDIESMLSESFMKELKIYLESKNYFNIISYANNENPNLSPFMIIDYLQQRSIGPIYFIQYLNVTPFINKLSTVQIFVDYNRVQSLRLQQTPNQLIQVDDFQLIHDKDYLSLVQTENQNYHQMFYDHRELLDYYDVTKILADKPFLTKNLQQLVIRFQVVQFAAYSDLGNVDTYIQQKKPQQF